MSRFSAATQDDSANTSAGPTCWSSETRTRAPSTSRWGTMLAWISFSAVSIRFLALLPENLGRISSTFSRSRRSPSLVGSTPLRLPTPSTFSTFFSMAANFSSLSTSWIMGRHCLPLVGRLSTGRICQRCSPVCRSWSRLAVVPCSMRSNSTLPVPSESTGSTRACHSATVSPALMAPPSSARISAPLGTL